MPILIGLGLLVLFSILSLTPEERAAARVQARRWDPLWWTVIVATLAFVFWPRG